MLDAAQLDTATVIGHEIGASVGVGLAARHPERVSQLVSLHGPAGDDATWQEVTAGWRERMAAITARDRDEGLALLETVAPSRAHDPAFHTWMDRAGRIGASPGTAGRIWNAIFETAPEENNLDLSDVQTPTLVLHRVDNVVVSVAGARALANRLPNAHLVLLPGADFVPYTGDVDALLAEVSAFVTGDHHALAPDRRMLAVLFTDLVDSTQQASSSGDANCARASRSSRRDRARRARPPRRHARQDHRRRHSRDVRQTRAARSPARPTCRAALADIGLHVRMGVHVGEVELREGDVAGLAVHVAARIMGAAGADDILASGAVALVAAGGAHQFTSLGRRSLKGLDGDWEIFSLVPDASWQRRRADTG